MMRRIIKFVLVGYLVLLISWSVNADISRLEYEKMPDLFYLDNYDPCMAWGEDALYCTITFQLAPMNNQSDIWKTIQNVIDNPRNYRHDRLRHGVCIATTCPGIPRNSWDNTTELLRYVSQCYQEKYREYDLTGSVIDMHCQSQQSPYHIDYIDIAYGCVCSLIVLIVISASIFDALMRYKDDEVYYDLANSTFGKIFVCFSLPNNWNRLRKQNTSEDGEKLASIQGIRFFNMVCVIMAHTVMIAFYGPILNPIYNEETTTKPLNMFLANGGYAVQTFFVISGWLLAHHFFLTFENKKNVDFKYIVLAFVNRYVRLTPVLLVVVGFAATWLPHLSSGPVWDKFIGQEYRSCRENWWTNALYINNYYDTENMCIQQTWYVAADTQLFLISLLILTALWKYQKFVVEILSACIFVGVLIPFLENYVRDYDIVVRSYPEVLYNLYLNVEQWHVMYTHGHNNLAGYMQGLLCGYLYNKYRRSNIFKSRTAVVLWWILTWTLPIGIILIASLFYQDGYEYTRVGAAFYQATGRYIFSVGISMAIFGITQGQGWMMKWVSEWSPVTILGRLTYCTYLIHTIFMRIRGGSQRTPLYVSDYQLVTTTLGDVAVAYLFAVPLCLFVEMPISALQKLMIPQLSDTYVIANPRSSRTDSAVEKNDDDDEGSEVVTHKF